MTPAKTPINMMDWQAQQKALKEQDRMSKTETAKFLQSYRGADESSGVSMLSTIKQEDRRGKEDAARFLHSYRGDAGSSTPLKARKATTPVKTTDPNAVRGNMQPDQRFGEESVASLAAGFHQNGAQNVPTSGNSMDESMQSMVMVDTSSPSPTESKESPILTTDAQRNAGEDDWVSVQSSNVPSPEKVEDMLREIQAQEIIPVDSFDSTTEEANNTDDISRAATEVAGNIDNNSDDDDISDATPLTEAQLHASGSRGGHLSLRLDVDFSFGLVSNDSQPDTDKYMKGVAAIAHLLFTENRPAGSMGHAIYNTNFYPFVRLVENDASAPKTFIVHASLPMFILDWAEAPNTRLEVRNALKAAVQDGRLLSLTRQ